MHTKSHTELWIYNSAHFKILRKDFNLQHQVWIKFWSWSIRKYGHSPIKTNNNTIINLNLILPYKKLQHNLPMASPSSFTEPVKIRSTATTTLCELVSPIDSCKTCIAFWSIRPLRAITADEHIHRNHKPCVYKYRLRGRNILLSLWQQSVVVSL